MARELPVLSGPRLTLRPMTADDVEALARMIAEPEIAQWWGPEGGNVDVQRADLFGYVAGDGAFAIEVEGSLAGWLGVEEENDPDYRSAGIDIFVGTAFHGQRIGPEALRMVARWLFDERGHHRLTIDPAVANERAITVYASVGFQPVGVLRNYERGADGTFHDGLLMDMLDGELR